MQKTINEISKVELDRELNVFVEDEIHAVIGGFLGSRSAILALNPDKYLSRDDTDEDEYSGYLLQMFFDTCFTFAKTGVWKDGDVWETLLHYHLFVNFEFPEDFHAGVGTSNREGHELVLETVCARMALYYKEVGDDQIPHALRSEIDGGLTKRQLALVAGLNEDTVRSAAYHKGDQKLDISPDGIISVEEATRWLKVKGRFQPLHFEGSELEYNPKFKLKTVIILFNFLNQLFEKLNLKWLDIEKMVPGEFRESFHSFRDLRIRRKDILDWLDIDIILHISELVKVNPEWLLAEIMRMRGELNLENAMSILKRIMKEEESKSDFRIDEEMPISVVSIRNKLNECPWISNHPLQIKPNTKMDGYRSNSGKSFTHQHEQKKQYLWLPEAILNDSASSLEMVRYPASELNKEGVYGRHSGLKKYPELVDESLVKIQIRSGSDLKSVLNMLK